MDEAMVPAWRAIGPKARQGFKACAFRTRGEAFAEWCQENSADFRRITFAALESGSFAPELRVEMDTCLEVHTDFETFAFDPDSMGLPDVDGAAVEWLADESDVTWTDAPSAVAA
jgi:hypothetical protein